MAPNIYCCGAGTAADTEAVTGTFRKNLGVVLVLCRTLYLKCWMHNCLHLFSFSNVTKANAMQWCLHLCRHGQLTAAITSLPYWSRVEGCYSTDSS
jgi:hypothetical protein